MTWALLGLINFYRKLISPILPASCRYQPSCSEYAVTAIATWGPFEGSWMAIKRVGRCHPFHAGGFDPVPRPPTVQATSARRD
ncbi:MAG: membrane protein insertion efficiency factor YidD [Actinomycetota bacterium]